MSFSNQQTPPARGSKKVNTAGMSGKKEIHQEDINALQDAAMGSPTPLRQRDALSLSPISNFRSGGRAEAELLRRRGEALRGILPVVGVARDEEGDEGDGEAEDEAGQEETASAAAPVDSPTSTTDNGTQPPPQVPGAAPGAKTKSRSTMPTYRRDYVDTHSATRNFFHRGKGYWAEGLPEAGADPTVAVRGPGAAAWKAQASAEYQLRAPSQKRGAKK